MGKNSGRLDSSLISLCSRETSFSPLATVLETMYHYASLCMLHHVGVRHVHFYTWRTSTHDVALCCGKSRAKTYIFCETTLHFPAGTSATPPMVATHGVIEINEFLPFLARKRK